MANTSPKRHIRHASVFYRLLFGAVRFYYHIYYKKVSIVGLERIPTDKAIIFAANHQNALMDALAILFAANRPVVFLARADIFQKKWIARLLYFARILPVYRMHDGASKVEKNRTTFDETVWLLNNGSALAIMPEGAFSPGKQLLPLKKGISRIAFQTAASTQFKMPLAIVPFGIDYEHPDKAGKHLLLRIGQPIDVSDYYEQYQHDPNQAMLLLREKLASALKKEIIHVQALENTRAYQLLGRLAYLAAQDEQKENLSRADRFLIEQAVAKRLNKLQESDSVFFTQLMQKSGTLNNLLQQLGMHEFALLAPHRPGLILNLALLWHLLMLPVKLIGWLVHFVPYNLPQYFSSKVEDQQFVSSLNFGISFFLYPVWYLILLLIMRLTGIGWVTSVFVVFSLPYAGLFAFYQHRNWKRLRAAIRVRKLLASNNQTMNKALKLALELQKEIQQLRNKAVTNDA